MVPLAAGEIRGLRAWWLRSRIARNAELNAEWMETRQVWRDLRVLRTATPPPRPTWPLTTKHRPTVTFGGKTMDRRLFLLAYASLFVSIMTVIVVRQNPTIRPPVVASPDTAIPIVGTPIKGRLPEGLDMIANANGVKWMAKTTYRGELNFFDEHHGASGSFGNGGTGQTKVAATVTVGDMLFELNGDVQGPTEYRLISDSGKALGYVQLVPQTEEERLAIKQEHFRQLGIEEELHFGNGASDGIGTANGYFVDKQIFRWTLTGCGEVRFRNVKTGKVVRRGFAHPEDHADPTKAERNTPPRLLWYSRNGGLHEFTACGPDYPNPTCGTVEVEPGIVLSIELAPWNKRFIPPTK